MSAREYKAPAVEVIAFEAADVILASEPLVTEVPVLKDDNF